MSIFSLWVAAQTSKTVDLSLPSVTFKITLAKLAEEFSNVLASLK